MNGINSKVIENAYSYETYRKLIEDLFAVNKNTGEDHSEAMLHYTKMNIIRMNRLDKKTELTAETLAFLNKIQSPQTWLVLTEGWCADAAQTIPVMNKMAAANEQIQLKLILRDQHLDIMDAFLTNGGRSIPKLIVLDENNQVLMSWGPRPTAAQKLMLEAKEAIQLLPQEDRKASVAQLKIDIQKWYNKDKTIHTQAEIVAALDVMTN